jgi:hypothetical protein
MWTETEARSRWCPFARSVRQIPVGGSQIAIMAHNRDNPDGNIPACIASSCMAWRWLTPKVLRDIDLVTSDVVEEKPRLGYCGLAGKPQWET